MVERSRKLVLPGQPIPADHPLLALRNVIVTPHAAALTRECAARMATAAARGLADVLLGRRPAHVANPQVFESLE